MKKKIILILVVILVLICAFLFLGSKKTNQSDSQQNSAETNLDESDEVTILSSKIVDSEDSVLNTDVISDTDLIDEDNMAEDATNDDVSENETLTDQDEYYNENSTVLNKYSVLESTSVQSESEAIEDFSNRGFGEYPITSDYLLDGEYTDLIEITESNEKHPVYQISYLSSNNELWTVMIMNSRITAYPVSYNFQSTRNAALIISESEVITAYDSEENIFYETIPKESALIVKVVDKIDASTLDSLTIEEIDRL